VRQNNVLFINSNDRSGERFSGIAWFDELEKQSWKAKMYVGNAKVSGNPDIETLFPGIPSEVLKIGRKREYVTGRQSSSAIWTSQIARKTHFKGANIVHYQIIHDGSWFRLESLPTLARKKPSLWTWHDAWPLTGHCIQPLDCDHFSKSCVTCPHMDWPLPIMRDTAGQERIRKRNIISKTKIPIHITTHWMEKLIHSTYPDLNLDTTVIPFGIDTDQFQPDQKHYTLKHNLVIGIRANNWVVKNHKMAIAILRETLKRTDKTITLITTDQYDLFKELVTFKNFKIIELGWQDEVGMINFFNSIDVLINVSAGESFGFISLEAAAMGVPSICLKNEATAELMNRIDKSFCIESNIGDGVHLLLSLINDPAKVLSSRIKSRHIVLQYYKLSDFISNMTNLYQRIVEEFE